MPELPEVEVVRRELSRVIDEKDPLKDLVFHRKDLRRPIPKKKLQSLVGSSIHSVRRRAKYLIFDVAQGHILSHLGMSGGWRQKIAGEDDRKHDHIELHFRSGTVLVFNDPRRFSLFEWIDSEKDCHQLSGLGPEPLSPEFTAAYLKNVLSHSQRAIKVSLMDSRIVVGVGNIYASEILFASGVRPQKISSKLTEKEMARIIENTQRILLKAIEEGGSTLRDFYHPTGGEGDFQQLHQVYGRESESCPVCRSLIRREVTCGRSTFWCSKCQR